MLPGPSRCISAPWDLARAQVHGVRVISKSCGRAGGGSAVGRRRAYSPTEPVSSARGAMPPLPDFSVDVLRHPGAVVVAPRGDVDMATVDQLRAASDVPDGSLVLDLRAVEFLDTSGINFILERQRHADAHGLSFTVVRGPEHVQRLFDIAGLNPRLRFVADPAEALADGRSAG